VAVEDPKLKVDVTQWLTRKYESNGVMIEDAKLEDLDIPNHLDGEEQPYLKMR